MKRYTFFSIILVLLISCGCSTGDNDPTVPCLTSGHHPAEASDSPPMLWGLWDIQIDTQKSAIEAIPLRGPDFTCNVTGFIDGPPVNLYFKDMTIDIQSGYTDISLDVGLRHPFYGLDMYTGFDVLGVFMGNGSDVYPSGDYTVAGDNDQRMLNPDGYTRWFNASEFGGAGSQMPLLGYAPGKLGSPDYTPSAELNPYKYFADDLEEEDAAFDFLVNNGDERGCFRPGSVNYRHYDLRFPDSTGLKFQYAVIAHWEPNENDPDPPESLDDFPLSANADEAVVISVVDSSTLFFENATTYGGNVILDISPLDWSATCSVAMEEYVIKCWSDAWTGDGAVNMEPVSSGDNYYTFRTDIPVDTLTSNDSLPVWIEIGYPGLDYTNPFSIVNDADGQLASCFQFDVQVSGAQLPYIEVTSPDGGEILIVGSDHEITWTSQSVPGNVRIEYSKDDFVSDINTIVLETSNDGSYLWTDIPNDPTETALIKIISIDTPSISDISDDYFTIKLPAGDGWVRTWGGDSSDRGYFVATDNPGNVYVTGHFHSWQNGNPVDFDPDPAPDKVDPQWAHGHLRYDVFLCKYDSDGIFQWARTWGGSRDDCAWGVVVDSSDTCIYVSGYFDGNNIDFDPDPDDEDMHSSLGGQHYGDVFVSKFDSDGDFKWARTWGGLGCDMGYGIAVGGPGDYVYITGSYLGTDVDFDPDPIDIDLHTSVSHDIFVSRFDSDGDFQWAQTWGAGDGEGGRGVAVDDSGYSYITGDFRETVDFDPDPVATNWLSSEGRNDIFLSSFDSNGDFRWAKKWGDDDYDSGRGIVLDANKDIYVTGYFKPGYFSDEVDFNPEPDVEDFHTSNGYYDVFLSKFDSAGTFQWAQTWGGESREEGWSIGADGVGYVYVTGQFHSENVGPIDFDPGSGCDPHESNGKYDVFISKFDSAGSFQWARTFGDFEDDEGWGVAGDNSGNVYVTGWFCETPDFDPGDGYCYKESYGYSDAFLLKFLPNGYWEW